MDAAGHDDPLRPSGRHIDHTGWAVFGRRSGTFSGLGSDGAGGLCDSELDPKGIHHIASKEAVQQEAILPIGHHRTAERQSEYFRSGGSDRQLKRTTG